MHHDHAWRFMFGTELRVFGSWQTVGWMFHTTIMGTSISNNSDHVGLLMCCAETRMSRSIESVCCALNASGYFAHPVSHIDHVRLSMFCAELRDLSSKKPINRMRLTTCKFTTLFIDANHTRFFMCCAEPHIACTNRSE